jgi:hypothetical protein
LPQPMQTATATTTINASSLFIGITLR